jgi:hypothetical protein
LCVIVLLDYILDLTQPLFWCDSAIVSIWLLSLTQLPDSDICQLTPPTLYINLYIYIHI